MIGGKNSTKKHFVGGEKMGLVKLLDVKHPIIQAPMAGVTTPEFVAASAETGVLGSIGAGYLSAEATRKFIREVKKLTTKPFAVNLFVPEKVKATEEQLQKAYEVLQPIANKLGIAEWNTPFSVTEFEGQVRVLIDEGVKVCSFTFGLPDSTTIKLLKENNIFLIGTATTPGEAQLLEKAGMDAIVAQGSEAGGHRGSFSGQLMFMPLDQLISSIIKSVTIPIIAAGGIADKEQMENVLAKGAQAVQIGTALLVANESGAHPVYKKAILDAVEGTTVLTTAFSGKAARGLRNCFTKEMVDMAIAQYPYQNDMTKEIRKAAANQGNSDYMSLWAGENVHKVKTGSIADILNSFI